MKEFLLILLFLPLIGFGQEIPLSEKKDSNKIIKIENKRVKARIDRKLKNELNRSLAMLPKDQIGYITNLKAHPWGGINYFHHWGKSLGWYVDYRPSMNEMHPEYENLEKYGSEEPPYSPNNQTLWTSVTNVGLSFRIFGNKNRTIMMYGGYGTTNTKTYYRYDDPIIESEYYDLYEGKSISSENYNFGFLIQKNAVISWQIGFDTALSGLNFGIGFS